MRHDASCHTANVFVCGYRHTKLDAAAYERIGMECCDNTRSVVKEYWETLYFSPGGRRCASVTSAAAGVRMEAVDTKAAPDASPPSDVLA